MVDMSVVLTVGIATLLALVNTKDIPGIQVSFAGDDLINSDILRSANATNHWKMYIDELLHMPSACDMAELLSLLPLNTIPAMEWCSIPEVYKGQYTYNSLNLVNNNISNVSKWLPCGAVVSQFRPVDKIYRESLLIQVQKDFHINISIHELYVQSFQIKNQAGWQTITF